MTIKIVISGRAHHHGFISKINQDGIVQWHKKIMEGFYFRIEDLVLTEDNKILIAGTNRESNDCLIHYHPFAASYNLDGEQIWGQHYENLIVSEFGSSINPTVDGGYVITTNRREYVNSSTWYGQLIKIDTTGAFLWAQTLRPDDFSMQHSSVMNAEGELTILGIDGPSYDESSHMTITQTSAEFETTCDQLNTSYIYIPFSSGTLSSLIVNDFSMINNVAQNVHTVDISGEYVCSTANLDDISTENIANFNSYPNPSNGIMNFSKTPEEIVVYNLMGTVLVRQTGKSTIDLNQLPIGTYLIEQKFKTNTIIEK